MQSERKENIYSHNTIIKPGVINEVCADLTPNESLDPSVEKFMIEMADNFIDNILETSCNLARNRKSDTLSITDIALAMDRNYNIYDPNKNINAYNKLKSNEVKNVSTTDHKRRVELTREETKI